jgi:hypothetical protein
VNAALAAAATLIAVSFAFSTTDRWLRRRRPHDLAWSVSLALFALGAASMWWGETRGWSLASFRCFYLFGAVLNVPWLALGTVYLLAGRSIVSGGELPAGKDVFGVAPRVLAAVGSGVAALVIVTGALWSAYRLARHRVPALVGADRSVASPVHLVVGNILIAAGTLVLSASGTLAGRLGKDRAFALTLVIGIAILFSGFLVASTTRRRPAQVLHQRAA